MSKTWKDDPYKDFSADRNNRSRRKALKKRVKEDRRLARTAERQTFAEEPIEAERSR